MEVARIASHENDENLDAKAPITKASLKLGQGEAAKAKKRCHYLHSWAKMGTAKACLPKLFHSKRQQP